MSTETKPRHIGRNISRLRELRGMKQLALAEAMGISQQAISNMESSETIEDDKLAQVAKALEVSVEAIRNFSEENVINYFNNFYDQSSGGNNIGAFGTMNCTFNPLDKLVEAYEENKKLYERLIEELKKK